MRRESSSRMLRSIVAIVFLSLFEGRSETIESLQQSALKWVDLREQSVQLESNWKWQKELLESTNYALAARADFLKVEIELLKAEIAGFDLEVSEKSSLHSAAILEMKELEELTDSMILSLLSIRPYLPPRLSNALELPYRSIEDAILSKSERLQHAISVFNRSFQFNKSATLSEEQLEGNDRFFEVLYWGLSHAYALDRQNQISYIGAPGENGWQWNRDDSVVDSTIELIAIFKGEVDPAFVKTPVKIVELEGIAP